MKIIVIEIDYHPEVLRNLLLLLHQSRYNVTVITTHKIWAKVSLSKEQYVKQIIFLDNYSNILQLVKKNKLINEANVIIFNTLNSHYKKFNEIELIPPTIARVHNTNTFFSSISKNYKPIYTPFFIWKDLSHFFRKSLLELDFYYRKKYLNKISYFSFFSDQMSQYAIKHDFITTDKIISPFIPSTFYDIALKKESSPTQTVHISIIGSIDKRRRDYDSVYCALKTIIPKTKQPIQLHLLGKPNGTYGKNIIKKFNSLCGPKFNITFSNEFVSQEKLENTLAQTDFLIIPIKEKTRHTIYTEFYGLTKISGSMNDIIKYGLPAIIPSFYPIDVDLSPATLPYTTSNLAKQIEYWISTKAYATVDRDLLFNKWSLKKAQKTLNESLEIFK